MSSTNTKTILANKWFWINENAPAAVPQHRGIHQAEENKVSSTSSASFRWICRKYSTSAKNTPTANKTSPRRIKWAERTWSSTEVTMDIISPVFDAIQSNKCVKSFALTPLQLQQRTSSLGIWHWRDKTLRLQREKITKTLFSDELSFRTVPWWWQAVCSV